MLYQQGPGPVPNKSLFGLVLKSDLLDLEEMVREDLPNLQGKTILIFGGTGFLGTWLTTSFLFLSQGWELDLKLRIVTREADNARARFPNIDLQRVEFIEWDLQERFEKELGPFDISISGPTPSTRKTLGSDVNLKFLPATVAAETIVNSAIKFENRPHVINLSSGAVYRQSRLIDRALIESDPLCSEQLTPYQEDKLLSELVLTTQEANRSIKLVNLRLFAFFGPLLALNEHFAIGNFLLDELSGRPITISGNPHTKRSYIYPSDFVLVIVKLLSNRVVGTFNLGGSKAITMFDLAKQIRGKVTCDSNQILFNESAPANFYYPDISKVRKTIGSFEKTSIEKGLARWKEWQQKINN